jgi:hypothetical protein
MDPAIVPHVLKGIPFSGRFLSLHTAFPLFKKERSPQGFPGHAIALQERRAAFIRYL